MPTKQPPRKTTHRPFWQADKPYLHSQNISDFRFRLLGYLMAALAGAINAGGFFAVSRYTSHVTGSLSQAADDFYLGDWLSALKSLSAILAFILGAAHAHWTILWAKRQRFRSSYGLALWLEAVYLLAFGLLGLALLQNRLWFSPAVLLLCFIMGMHNTVLSVLSGSVLRSTHMTGTATDLGIELAKMLYYSRNNHPRLPDVHVNRPKAKLLLGMLLSFLGGGIIGAWGYHRSGHHFALPVAAVLVALGSSSVGYDVRIRIKWWLRRKWRRREESKNQP